MDEKTIITVVAIICITIVEICALALGHDGVMLSLVVATLAGLGGYEIGLKIFQKE